MRGALEEVLGGTLGTVGVGALETVRGGGGILGGTRAGTLGGTPGVGALFIISSRSNSLSWRAGIGCCIDPVGLFIIGADAGACICGVAGLGRLGVITPSLTTGSCVACFDHPLSGLLTEGAGCFAGCGAWAGLLRLLASGAVPSDIPFAVCEMTGCGFGSMADGGGVIGDFSSGDAMGERLFLL